MDETSMSLSGEGRINVKMPGGGSHMLKNCTISVTICKYNAYTV